MGHVMVFALGVFLNRNDFSSNHDVKKNFLNFQ